LSAEFETLMGKQDRLQAQGLILGKDNEAVASGPAF